MFLDIRARAVRFPVDNAVMLRATAYAIGVHLQNDIVAPLRSHLGFTGLGYQFAFLRRLSASRRSLVLPLVGGVKIHPPDGDGLRCSMARARLSFLMSLDSIPAWYLALLAMLILLLLSLGVGYLVALTYLIYTLAVR